MNIGPPGVCTSEIDQYSAAAAAAAMNNQLFKSLARLSSFVLRQG